MHGFIISLKYFLICWLIWYKTTCAGLIFEEWFTFTPIVLYTSDALYIFYVMLHEIELN